MMGCRTRGVRAAPWVLTRFPLNVITPYPFSFLNPVQTIQPVGCIVEFFFNRSARGFIRPLTHIPKNFRIAEKIECVGTDGAESPNIDWAPATVGATANATATLILNKCLCILSPDSGGPEVEFAPSRFVL